MRAAANLLGRAAGETALVEAAGLESLRLRYLSGAETDPATVVRQVEASLPVLEAAANHDGLGRAWRLLTQVHLAACDWGAAELAAASRAHTEALDLAEEAFRLIDGTDDPNGQASALADLAEVCALAGRHAHAAAHAADAVARFEQKGNRAGAAQARARAARFTA